MDIIRKLKLSLANSGLNELEIEFYINVLKKPESTVYEIAKKSKIAKDHAYKICESLEEKKLITCDIKKVQKRLKATPLNSYIENLYSKGRTYYHNADNLKEIKNFLPFLSLPDQENSFETYTEENLAEKFLDLSYLNWEKVLAYGCYEISVEKIGVDPDKEFVNKRLKKGKKCFPILANPGPYSLEILGNDIKEMRKSKIVYDDKLKNFFAILFPDLNITSLWIKNDNGILSGATIKSPIITKFHESMYSHFNEIAKNNFS